MMDEPGLFDLRQHRHRLDPNESADAYRDAGQAAARWRDRIEAWARSRGRRGITAHEAEEHFGRRGCVLRQRVSDLKVEGRLVLSSQRRATANDKLAGVLVTPEYATPAEIAEAAHWREKRWMQRQRPLAVCPECGAPFALAAE